MRPAREAKQPRRPRVITWRLVVVSLVVGVVLAVVSGPVCALVWEMRGARRGEAELLACWHAQGHTVLVSRDDDVGVTIWDTVSEPDADGSTMRFYMDEPRMRRVDRDVRPEFVRTALDGERRSRSSHRLGWPLRAAERSDRWDPATERRIAHGELTVRVSGRTLRIPTHPLWPGLLGNTAFYVGLLLAAVALLRWRRLRRRARRGSCLACGYGLGEGVGACPECGLALRAS